jgi:hypothetical protein
LQELVACGTLSLAVTAYRIKSLSAVAMTECRRDGGEEVLTWMLQWSTCCREYESL